MRSEERSGIVFLFVLFLWGTPVTEPFRVFVEYLSEFVFYCTKSVKLSENSIGAIIINTVVLCAFTVGLLLLSKTRFVTAIPLIVMQAILIVLIFNILHNYSFNLKRMIFYLILLCAISLLFAFHQEKVLIWIADMFIFSIPVFLICSLLLGNIKVMNFITRKQSVFFISSFDGVFKINGILWGIFWVVLVLLPIIYNIPGRRK